MKRILLLLAILFLPHILIAKIKPRAMSTGYSPAAAYVVYEMFQDHHEGPALIVTGVDLIGVTLVSISPEYREPITPLGAQTEIAALATFAIYPVVAVGVGLKEQDEGKTWRGVGGITAFSATILTWYFLEKYGPKTQVSPTSKTNSPEYQLSVNPTAAGATLALTAQW